MGRKCNLVRAETNCIESTDICIDSHVNTQFDEPTYIKTQLVLQTQFPDIWWAHKPLETVEALAKFKEGITWWASDWDSLLGSVAMSDSAPLSRSLQAQKQTEKKKKTNTLRN